MAKTVLADVIVPSVFEDYVIERTAALSAFVQSGIVVRDPYFDALAAGGGQSVNMPFWQDVNPARQVLSDGGALTVNKITASQDIARIHMDGQAWGSNDLVKAFAGSDPIGALVNLCGDYWARTSQAFLFSCLKGIFGAATMAGNKLSIAAEATGSVTDATRLTASTFVDATVKLGDRSADLTAVAMHSATEAYLRKADLITVLPGSDGKAQVTQFQGRRVIVDDTCPVRAGSTSGYVYTTYLFGPGAFGHGVARLDTPVQGGHGTEAVEWERSGLDSDTRFINRRRFLLHPRGVKFTSASVAGASPTNTELETASNWIRVFEAKNVKIVAVEHNN